MTVAISLRHIYAMPETNVLLPEESSYRLLLESGWTGKFRDGLSTVSIGKDSRD